MFEKGVCIGFSDRKGNPINIGSKAKYYYQEEDYTIGEFKYYRHLLAIGFKTKDTIIFFNTESCPEFVSGEFEVIQ